MKRARFSVLEGTNYVKGQDSGLVLVSSINADFGDKSLRIFREWYWEQMKRLSFIMNEIDYHRSNKAYMSFDLYADALSDDPINFYETDRIYQLLKCKKGKEIAFASKDSDGDLMFLDFYIKLDEDRDGTSFRAIYDERYREDLSNKYRRFFGRLNVADKSFSKKIKNML